MSARLTIISGPARSGKTERLLAGYRQALRDRPPNSTLWLSPTWRAAGEVRDRLLDGHFRGCLSPGVTTFDKFSVEVLRHAGKPIRPLNRLMKRELVRDIIAGAASRGRLKHFLPIAKTGGLADLVCEFISELKRLEIWPPEFLEACKKRGLTDKDSELYEIYEEYQQSLLDHGLFDLEGRIWSARDILKSGEWRVESGEWREQGEEKREESGGRGGEVSNGASSARDLPLAISHSLPSLIVVDGFTDFTRTQHEILDGLAEHADEMYVSLPLEPEPQRTDLFAKPLKTLGALQKRHPSAVVEWIGRPTKSQWTAMDRLERGLFENPRRRERGDGIGESAECETASGISGTDQLSVPNIEILAAARQIGEIEMIAARIKLMLIDGDARLDEIVVVFRSPQGMAELVEEVFGRLGIPLAFESGQTLERRPAVRALTNLLQLDLDDWPFGRLLAVLGSNFFQPDWPEFRDGDPAEIERTVRALQVPRGREKLIEQLASVGGDSSRRSASGETGNTQSASGDASCNLTSAVAKHLAAAFDALPPRATLPDWADHWGKLAEHTGLLRAVKSGPTSDDFDAWRRLTAVLKSSETLAEWLSRRPVELDRRAAFDTLLDIIGSDRLGSSDDQRGRVRVLSATGVRSLRVPHLFLAGLSEKVFPPPDREDRLYSDAEYLRLIEAAPKLPLVTRAERARDEMLLFYEAITRATKRLYLSYPALDESAQPLLPSPFLGEVEEVFGPGAIRRVEQVDLSPVPLDDEPLSAAEFRVKAVATALEGNVALLAGLFGSSEGGKGERGEKREEGREKREDDTKNQPSSSSESLLPPPSSLLSLPSAIAAGLTLLHSRHDCERFGPAEGVIRGDGARRLLAAEYSAQRTFSATELERYASCPFRFLMERILKVEPIEDLSLEFDVLNRGRIVHEVLSRFHKNVNGRLGCPGSPLQLEPAEFDALMAEAIEKSLPAEPSNPLRAAMREIDRRLVAEWMAGYRNQCEKYDSQWKGFDAPPSPELFEAAFGRGGEEPPSTAEPLKFLREDETINLSGRIDRVDVGTIAGQTVFNVLDYKSGGSIRMTPESVRSGTTLQLPLYALATAELLLSDRDAVPWRAGYWYVRDAGYKPRAAMKMYVEDGGRIELDQDWEEIRASLGDVVAELIHAIRRGRFPVCSADEHCTGRCPYSTVCRINHVRSLEKICRPTDDE